MKVNNSISRHLTFPLLPPRRVSKGQVRARALQLVGLGARGPRPWRAEVWGWQAEVWGKLRCGVGGKLRCGVGGK